MELRSPDFTSMRGGDEIFTNLPEELQKKYIGLGNELTAGMVRGLTPSGMSYYVSKKKEKLLDEMRSTRVIGRCSQDDSPREHAVNIALLSAETNNWEVFIKAHLDILNDSFDRMSDGSYAWNRRKTYIREIEDLNIDVEDLILGISLRIENPENNSQWAQKTTMNQTPQSCPIFRPTTPTIKSIPNDPSLNERYGNPIEI
jgi:hypothetical protein